MNLSLKSFILKEKLDPKPYVLHVDTAIYILF